MGQERIEQEILTEARRAIGVQVAALDELRARTGLLLAAASLSGSFLGAAAAKHQSSLGVVGVIAIVAFGLGVGSCIRVLWPKNRGWTFVNSPSQLIADWVEIDRQEESMPVFLAEKMEGHFKKNKRRLDRLYLWFQAAAVSVGASVILGSVHLATQH
ncbi:MAG TPA: hypothetical protein VFK14_09425 [Solirubrobacterales bacterium]|nr:hypothetical protein [Solirubrobacterales bacterium]